MSLINSSKAFAVEMEFWHRHGFWGERVVLRAVNKGHNPLSLLLLSTVLYVLWCTFDAMGELAYGWQNSPTSNKFVLGVKIKVTSDSKLNESLGARWKELMKFKCNKVYMRGYI